MAQQYKLWILIESRVVKQKRTRMQNNGCCYKTMDAATKQEVLERHNKNIVFVRMKL